MHGIHYELAPTLRGIIFCELRVVSCELSVASWLLIIFCELRVASCELRVGFPSYQFILLLFSNFRL